MTKEKIVSTAAPAAIGPYSQAIKQGNMLFTSGVIPLDKDGNFSQDIKEQTAQALANLRHVLAAGGCDMADVVKTTCFIKDMNQFADINEVYAQFFSEPYPARSCIEAARLPKDIGIEIEAIAFIK